MLGNNYIPIPPLEEQEKIVKSIDARINKIDQMIKSLTEEIDKLAEYKQCLISDVVTGVADVRDES